MKCKICAVKKGGKIEEFSEKKVYFSCYKSFLVSKMEKEKAKEICKKIATQIKEWAKKQREITTKEISEKIISLLNKKDKKVAYMYKSFKDIS
jgi:transcriptional regulator NrdR family protein